MSSTQYVTMQTPVASDEDPYGSGGYAEGARVKVGDGLLNGGRTGTVTGWARGTGADERFRANEAAAKTAGRTLTADDYEPLIDSEGPLVRYDDRDPADETLDWYPGQAMGCLELATA